MKSSFPTFRRSCFNHHYIDQCDDIGQIRTVIVALARCVIFGCYGSTVNEGESRQIGNTSNLASERQPQRQPPLRICRPRAGAEKKRKPPINQGKSGKPLYPAIGAVIYRTRCGLHWKVPSGIPDCRRACCWDGYDPSIIQKPQEADAGVLVHREKPQTGFTPLQPPMFCHVCV